MRELKVGDKIKGLSLEVAARNGVETVFSHDGRGVVLWNAVADLIAEKFGIEETKVFEGMVYGWNKVHNQYAMQVIAPFEIKPGTKVRIEVLE